MDFFKPHKINWSKEKISRFWDYMAENQPDTYWSKATGKNLLDLVGKRIPFKGSALDYGCGVGYLIEHLLGKKIKVAAIEVSEKSASAVRNRFENHPLFGGVFKSSDGIASESTDLVFLVEIVEHLLPEEVSQVLSESQRILKENGFLIVTVPNEENIKKSSTICPDCGGIFHRMQHLRSFSAEDLTGLLENSGFKKEFCQPVILEKVSPLKKIYWFFKKMAGYKIKKHYLIYIGRKIKK